MFIRYYKVTIIIVYQICMQHFCQFFLALFVMKTMKWTLFRLLNCISSLFDCLGDPAYTTDDPAFPTSSSSARSNFSSSPVLRYPPWPGSAEQIRVAWTLSSRTPARPQAVAREVAQRGQGFGSSSCVPNHLLFHVYPLELGWMSFKPVFFSRFSSWNAVKNSVTSWR